MSKVIDGRPAEWRMPRVDEWVLVDACGEIRVRVTLNHRNRTYGFGGREFIDLESAKLAGEGMV